MTDLPIIPISAIEHFSYCKRQCALIHVDGVWRDNRYTVQGTRGHRRVDSGRHRMEKGVQMLRSIPLWSETLGLSGRADAVAVRGVEVYPIEYKSGIPHGITADLQVCAQALCFEEMLNVEIPFGYVWYAGPRRRFRVDFTPAIRQQVVDIVLEIRAQIETGKLPNAPNDERCVECQLRSHCLPELTSASRRVAHYMSEVVFK